jgi:FixJ family two-component response regulator
VHDPNAAIICVLDDDLSVLNALGRLFLSAGWHTQKFSDPEKFLLHTQTYRTPVAVFDVAMPLMNGLEVQSRLRQLSPSTRAIIFTGRDDASVRSAALNAGASAFFTKPFDDKEFLTAVRSALASAA